jgi:hypothetical protein
MMSEINQSVVTGPCDLGAPQLNVRAFGSCCAAAVKAQLLVVWNSEL